VRMVLNEDLRLEKVMEYSRKVFFRRFFSHCMAKKSLNDWI
jgi:hypothetical protein